MIEKIKNECKDFTIKYLHIEIESGNIDLQPYYQRQYVYNNKKASYLIESLLMDMPIPPVYLCEENHVYEVIDGQQRLTTINRFLNNELMLSNLMNLKHLNGLYYKDLNTIDQRQIDNFCFKVNIIKTDDNNVKYDMFARLNTGAMALNPQEIRNCIYRGHFNDMLKKLANNKEVQRALFKPNVKNKRFAFEEKILFFLYFNYLFQNKKIDTLPKSKKEGASAYMHKAQKEATEEQVEEMYNIYVSQITGLYKIFGDLLHNTTDRYLILDLLSEYDISIIVYNKKAFVDIMKFNNERNIDYIRYKSDKHSVNPYVLKKRHQIIKDEIDQYLELKRK